MLARAQNKADWSVSLTSKDEKKSTSFKVTIDVDGKGDRLGGVSRFAEIEEDNNPPKSISTRKRTAKKQEDTLGPARPAKRKQIGDQNPPKSLPTRKRTAKKQEDTLASALPTKEKQKEKKAREVWLTTKKRTKK